MQLIESLFVLIQFALQCQAVSDVACRRASRIPVPPGGYVRRYYAILRLSNCYDYSVYYKSHDASVSAGVLVLFRMHDGNCSVWRGYG